MGTIVHAFDPGASVYVITTATSDCPAAILEGTVIQVRINALTTGTTVLYDIKLADGSGTTEFKEADIFASLEAGTGSPNVTGALEEYKTRL